MDEIGRERQTSHEMIVKVWRARKINKVFGELLVTPFTLSELTEDWLDVFDNLYEFETHEQVVANAEQRAKQDFERVLAGKRAARGYRSYLR